MTNKLIWYWSLGIGACLMVLTGCSSAVPTSSPSALPVASLTPSLSPTFTIPPFNFPFPDPHNHVVEIHNSPGENEVLSGLQVVSVELALDQEIGSSLLNLTVSPGSKYRAFSIVFHENTTSERIFIQDLGTKEVLEIVGIPYEWRPFSDVVWLTDDILAFDRWAQPHFGVHMVVDITTRTPIIAAPFPDQWLLDQQQGNGTPTP